ncbi:hypothetical protein BSPWISOXPB_2932 [uncultured Gammaproteobacteria bacterium]|nr:hypothetical protein BSPWISOXPB_2932 [uncultured Gammaproteobacteria bacterium]
MLGIEKMAGNKPLFFLFWQKLGLFFVKYLRFFAVLDKKQFC